MHEQIIRSGFLLKRGEGARKAWKRRWFVLRPSRLCYYKDDREYKLIRAIDLSIIDALAPVPRKKRSFVFGMVSHQRKYYMQASSQGEMEGWLNDLRSVRLEIERQKKLLHHQHHPPPPPPPTVEGVTSRKPDPTPPTAPMPIPKGTVIPGATSSTNPTIPSTTIPSTSVPATSLIASSPPSEDLARQSTSHLQHANRVLSEGYLRKQCDRNTTWRKRWFVLRPGTLTYYKNQKEYELHRMIPISKLVDVIPLPQPSSGKRKWCFKVITPERSFIVSADDEAGREQWVRALDEEIKRVRAGE
ncbi:MAG: hypothetical protein DHS80DRAFT_18005 [Piptocephalis tieghemiana]|nr:MAG: hypothetical protein DHS80DRAFT_18005 [Piptocephalis tieghemiana]